MDGWMDGWRDWRDGGQEDGRSMNFKKEGN